MKFRTKRKIIKLRKIIIQAIQISVGTALIAISTSLFLLPNQLSSGGFSGLATITYYLFGIPLRNNGFNIECSIVCFISNKKWKKVFY